MLRRGWQLEIDYHVSERGVPDRGDDGSIGGRQEHVWRGSREGVAVSILGCRCLPSQRERGKDVEWYVRKVGVRRNITNKIARADRDSMPQGIPLNDDDRREWLALLAAHMAQAYRERDVTGDKALVLACSALKARYRDTLTSWCADELHSETARPLVLFCVLHARCEVLVERLEQRSRAGGHFMPPSLLQSQLDTLEMPSPGAQDDFSANMAIDVESAEPDQVAVQVLAELTRLGALVPPQ